MNNSKEFIELAGTEVAKAKQTLESYVKKFADANRLDAVVAHGVLAEKRDPTYRQLVDAVRNTQYVAFQTPLHVAAQEYDAKIEALRVKGDQMVQAYALQHNLDLDLARLRLERISFEFQDIEREMHVISKERFDALKRATMASEAIGFASLSGLARGETTKAAADTGATMTPSEAELHKRAAVVAAEKRISQQSALGHLMETDAEARKLYRQIPFEKNKR